MSKTTASLRAVVRSWHWISDVPSGATQPNKWTAFTQVAVLALLSNTHEFSLPTRIYTLRFDSWLVWFVVRGLCCWGRWLNWPICTRSRLISSVPTANDGIHQFIHSRRRDEGREEGTVEDFADCAASW